MKVNCKYCNLEIERPLWQIKKTKNSFCNSVCHGKWKSKNLVGENHPTYAKIKTNCAQCGIEIIRSKSHIKRNNFCSIICHNKWVTDNKQPTKYITVVSCAFCGKDIEKDKWQAKIYKNNFCDRACYGNWKTENESAENSVSWKGGPGLYKGRGWYIRGKKLQHERMKLPKNRLAHRMSTAIRLSLKGKKNGRSWEKLVGYTRVDLKEHLEKLFTDGMSWDNIEDWHIDHIVPKILFNYTRSEDKEFQKCWALENLQPLWAVDNMRKGSDINWSKNNNL